jgi:hypothetical protein
MSKHKSGSPTPPETCIIVVDAIIDEFEVEIPADIIGLIPVATFAHAAE